MEYYTLDKIKSKNFKKEFAFLIYDEKDYYYFLDDNILENSNVSSILKFSEELENIYDIVDEDAKVKIERYTLDGAVHKKTSAVVDDITIFHIEKVEDIDTNSEDQ
jgi:hypothetical protein